MSSVLAQIEFDNERSYPIFNLQWYQQLPAFQQYTIHKIAGLNKILDSGSHHSVMYRITLDLEDKISHQRNELNLLAKFSSSKDDISQDNRELRLYNDVIQQLSDDNKINTKSMPVYVPTYYYGEESPDHFGKLLLISEIPNAVQCGLFYGNCSPHNRGKDLKQLTSLYPHLSPITITKKAFAAISRLHAKFWNNLHHNLPNYLPGYDVYMRSTDNQQQQDRYQQEKGQYLTKVNLAKTNFLSYPKRTGVHFPQKIIDMINTSLERSTWEQFYKENILQSDDDNETDNNDKKNNNNDEICSKFPKHLKKYQTKTPFTLIHNDFYPANLMISSSSSSSLSSASPSSSSLSLPAKTIPVNDNHHEDGNYHQENNHHHQDNHIQTYIIDFELAVISHPVQDLTEYIISHLDPTLRLRYEDELLDVYYDSLMTNFIFYNQTITIDEFKQYIYPYQQLKEDYRMGCSRWFSLIALSCDWDFIPDVLLQHFIDQTMHFITTHKVDIDNCPILKLC